MEAVDERPLGPFRRCARLINGKYKIFFDILWILMAFY